MTIQRHFCVPRARVLSVRTDRNSKHSCVPRAQRLLRAQHTETGLCVLRAQRRTNESGVWMLTKTKPSVLSPGERLTEIAALLADAIIALTA